MAIDSNLTPPSPETASVSAIENEFPTYRAISPLAVVGLLFGVFSILCFTHWFFLSFAALAILLGVLAERKIRRMPDVLTGRGLAQASIALGLVFGLASVTIAGVQDFVLVNQAKKFARTYVAALQKGPLAEAIYYHQPHAYRKDKTPQAILKEMRKSGQSAQMFEMQESELIALRKRLDSSPQEKIHFVRIENHSTEGLNAHVAALLEVDGPGSKTYPNKEENALVVFKGSMNNRKYEWIVESVKYPYRRNTYVPPVKPVDDGHGHNDGGHH